MDSVVISSLSVLFGTLATIPFYRKYKERQSQRKVQKLLEDHENELRVLQTRKERLEEVLALRHVGEQQDLQKLYERILKEVQERQELELLQEFGEAPRNAQTRRMCESLLSLSLAKRGDLELEGRIQCVACQDADRCILLQPCNHVCLCRECWQMILEADPLCPVCRNRVQKNMVVYL